MDALPVDLGWSTERDVHIMPAWEDGEHDDSHLCRCEPRIECEDHWTRKRVYVHHSRECAL